jgi:hypothetical protein
VSLSDAFSNALQNVLQESSTEGIADLVEKMPVVCARAMLRVHPGGELFEEDLEHLIKEVHVAVLDSMLYLATSYGLLDSCEGSAFSLSEEFKDELSLVLTRDRGANPDARSYVLDKVAQVCRAAALAKGDSDPLRHITATLGVGVYMNATGIMEKICGWWQSDTEEAGP